MRVRSAAAPRHAPAIARAAAVAAAAPCAALLDGVRVCVVVVVVACAAPLAPALRVVSRRFNSAAAMNVLSLQQCAELSGIEALQRGVCNRVAGRYRCNAELDFKALRTEDSKLLGSPAAGI